MYRRGLVLALVIGFTCASPASASALGYNVDDLGDAGDADTTDAVCATAGGVCTLRAAVEQSGGSGSPHVDSITVPAGTITLGSELLIANQELGIGGRERASPPSGPRAHEHCTG